MEVIYMKIVTFVKIEICVVQTFSILNNFILK
jgi:hypothetical protein